MILKVILGNHLEEYEVYLREEFLNEGTGQGSNQLDSFSVYMSSAPTPMFLLCLLVDRGYTTLYMSFHSQVENQRSLEWRLEKLLGGRAYFLPESVTTQN